jgi:hypothetical protein
MKRKWWEGKKGEIKNGGGGRGEEEEKEKKK